MASGGGVSVSFSQCQCQLSISVSVSVSVSGCSVAVAVVSVVIPVKYSAVGYSAECKSVYVSRLSSNAPAIDTRRPHLISVYTIELIEH